MNWDADSPIVEIHDQRIEKAGIRLFVKQDDLLHPVVSGNKLRKLKYYLLEARKKGLDKIVTFGGAFSNHIVATAFAAKSENLTSIGIIRGEEPPDGNPSLREAAAYGMKLHFISRSEFAWKDSEGFFSNLKSRFGDFLLIPEGGTGPEGVRGVAESCSNLGDFSHIAVPVGTGTTLAGVVNGTNDKQSAIGFAVLKGKDYLEENVSRLIHNNKSNWMINHEFHFGGYAKFDGELISFINEFSSVHKIQLDPIYTGKMMFGMIKLIENNFFPDGSKVVAIHTGGLQGIAGFNERFGNLIQSI